MLCKILPFMAILNEWTYKMWIFFFHHLLVLCWFCFREYGSVNIEIMQHLAKLSSLLMVCSLHENNWNNSQNYHRSFYNGMHFDWNVSSRFVDWFAWWTLITAYYQFPTVERSMEEKRASGKTSLSFHYIDGRKKVKIRIIYLFMSFIRFET